MHPIWNEDDVTIDKLAEHLNVSGYVFLAQEKNRIWLRTDIGISFSVTLMEEQKFIRLSTYFPLDGEQSLEKRHELERSLNAQILLPSFSIDDDDDLNIVYVVSYCFGLIPGQLMFLLKRFEGLLNYLVTERNPDGLILLGKYQRRLTVPALDDALPPEEVLLN